VRAPNPLGQFVQTQINGNAAKVDVRNEFAHKSDGSNNRRAKLEAGL
jgi:hypothetical protein